MFEFNTNFLNGIAQWFISIPSKVFFGCIRQDFVGCDARIAPSSTCANISKNPLRVTRS